jgi:hypothetical protein
VKPILSYILEKAALQNLLHFSGYRQRFPNIIDVLPLKRDLQRSLFLYAFIIIEQLACEEIKKPSSPERRAN